jgi:hypothetical protein
MITQGLRLGRGSKAWVRFVISDCADGDGFEIKTPYRWNNREKKEYPVAKVGSDEIRKLEHTN